MSTCYNIFVCNVNECQVKMRFTIRYKGLYDMKLSHHTPCYIESVVRFQVLTASSMKF
jgi:hypothetical protein